jgi:hypothetical protein
MNCFGRGFLTRHERPLGSMVGITDRIFNRESPKDVVDARPQKGQHDVQLGSPNPVKGYLNESEKLKG